MFPQHVAAARAAIERPRILIKALDNLCARLTTIFLAAIEDIVAGRMVNDLLGNSGSVGGGGTREPMSAREGEVLRLVADGYSNKMIARALEITDGTVKLHVKAILRKLGMRSRVEAAVSAVEHGLGKNRRKPGPPPGA